MVYYIFFEPRVIADAAHSGNLGIQLLLSILKAIKQNCTILEFHDNYTKKGINAQINKLDVNQHEIKIIKSALIWLAKNRFTYALEPDWMNSDNNKHILEKECENELLDALLLAEADEISPAGEVEVLKLGSFQTSKFEEKRAKHAQGRALTPDTLESASFLTDILGKSLRHARLISFYDRNLTRHWGSNYDYTIQQLFTWLGQNLKEPKDSIFTLHTEAQTGLQGNDLEHRLRISRNAAIPNLKVEVKYYAPGCLHHDRFFTTNQFAFVIGRGMDFLNQSTKTNRDVTINFLDRVELSSFLKKCDEGLVDTVSV